MVDTAALFDLLWSGLPSEDVSRWFAAPLQFVAAPPWGLAQRSGGPCGVLAALQAFVIARLLWPGLSLAEAPPAALPPAASGALAAPSEALLRGALSHGLAALCWQAGGGARCVLVRAAPEALPLRPDAAPAAAALEAYEFSDFDEAEACAASLLDQFGSASGE